MVSSFHAAVMRLGKNDRERAQALGMKASSIQKWRRGQFPSNLRVLMNHPQLMSALAADAEALAAHRDASQPTTEEAPTHG